MWHVSDIPVSLICRSCRKIKWNILCAYLWISTWLTDSTKVRINCLLPEVPLQPDCPNEQNRHGLYPYCHNIYCHNVYCHNKPYTCHEAFSHRQWLFQPRLLWVRVIFHINSYFAGSEGHFMLMLCDSSGDRCGRSCDSSVDLNVIWVVLDSTVTCPCDMSLSLSRHWMDERHLWILID